VQWNIVDSEEPPHNRGFFVIIEEMENGFSRR